MRIRLAILSVPVLALALAACGDNQNDDDVVDARVIDAAMIDGAIIDAPDIDAAVDAAIDAPVDAAVDAEIDAPPTPSDLIGFARAAADGSGLSLAIEDATITYIKPAIGNDVPGFTIQAAQMGPALMIAVDPASLTPAPAVGDVVSFTITDKETAADQPRATAITGYTRTATGTDVDPLVQDVSAATDLVTNVDAYDSELIDVTGEITGTLGNSGTGFERFPINTAGITAPDVNFQLRMPATLRDALDVTTGCDFMVNNTPMHRFTTGAGTSQTQVSVFQASELTLSNCPAPVVMAALATSGTSVVLTFSRRIDPASVMADGSQFTINGLTVTAAAVSDRTVTLTTSAQTGGTMYTVTVANTVTDLQGTGVGTPNTAMFAGFVTPATVRINEVNANVGGGCDLIELRVVSGGSMDGMFLRERNSGSLVTFNGLSVATNDIIVVHINGNSATCNPSGATDELTGPAAQPAAMHARNYDTAFDWYSTDTGLTSTDNVFTLYNAANVILDAVFIDDGQTGSNVAAATESQAAMVAAANQWQQVGGGVPAGGFVDDDFRINAAQDSDATGTDATGITIQRIDDTDDNDVADWSASPGAAQSWGLLNAGQTPF